jgi:thymidylate synthase (FAD)
MAEIEFSSDITVKLVRAMAADEFVVQAAQVSAKGETDVDDLVEAYLAGDLNVGRFIAALMKGRHGSPFEHNAFTFFVEAPLFVFREWQRHRISSFNEMSGRYTVLPGKFYIPGPDRKAYNIGTKMKPQFVDIETARAAGKVPDWNHESEGNTWASLRGMADAAWEEYLAMLEGGIATEVARMVLPVNIYSQMYWTVNARSLMNFLSLRVESDDSLVRSYPQKEIQMGAERIEEHFAELMPVTHAAFVSNGRVAP